MFATRIIYPCAREGCVMMPFDFESGGDFHESTVFLPCVGVGGFRLR